MSSQIGAYCGPAGPSMISATSDEHSVFTATQWGRLIEARGRCGGVFPLQDGKPLVTVAEAFSVLQAAANDSGAGRLSDFKMYIAGRLLPPRAATIPSASDAGLAEWIDRVDTATDSADFLVYANRVERWSRKVWFRVFAALRELSERYGVAAGAVEVEVFAGRYKMTAGGIHRASCANLHFVIDGTKSFYVWPPEAAGPEDSFVSQTVTGTEEYLEHASLGWRRELCEELRAGPGEVIYGPAMFWHVVGAKTPCLALNVSLYTDPWRRGRLPAIVDAVVDWTANPDGRALRLSLMEGLDNGRIADLLDCAALRHETAFGLSPVPLVSGPSVGDDQEVRLALPVRWKRLSSGRVAVAALGHLWETSTPAVEATLARLAAGHVVRATELGEFTDGAPSELATGLAATGALAAAEHFGAVS